MVFQYWFFSHGLKFQGSVCNGSNNLIMLCLKFSDIAIAIVKNGCYRCIFNDISNSKAIHVLNNYALYDRGYI